MIHLQGSLEEFMFAAQVAYKTKPGLPDSHTWEIAKKLVREEVMELQEAIKEFEEDWILKHIQPRDLKALAVEAADVIYVVSYMCAACGIPIDAVFAEIHEANMRKIGPDGTFLKNEFGKVLKPAGWQPADIEGVLMGNGP